MKVITEPQNSPLGRVRLYRTQWEHNETSHSGAGVERNSIFKTNLIITLIRYSDMICLNCVFSMVHFDNNFIET